MKLLKKSGFFIVVCALALASGCLPGGQESKGGRIITVYGFSIMKEALEKDVYPAFAAKWKAEHGKEIHRSR